MKTRLTLSLLALSLGISAGSHVAAWTAIPEPASEKTAKDPIPKFPPAGLLLLGPVPDTTAQGYGGPKRFDNDEARAAAVSLAARIPAKMPPTCDQQEVIIIVQQKPIRRFQS